MLLTLSTAHQPAIDLGYLLHKHPDRAQAFELAFGTAHLFSTRRRWHCGSSRWAWRGWNALSPPCRCARCTKCAFALRALESEPVDPQL